MLAFCGNIPLSGHFIAGHVGLSGIVIPDLDLCLIADRCACRTLQNLHLKAYGSFCSRILIFKGPCDRSICIASAVVNGALHQLGIGRDLIRDHHSRRRIVSFSICFIILPPDLVGQDFSHTHQGSVDGHLCSVCFLRHVL